ncbi:MAG: hypothetical protein EI684_03995 [Candidatus Viridilinea halotolerans]|uniref:YfhO family protein n=1 Tax=Candidatus Viridilinea halotolerans TaxID=2491704 RepID=A0A426U6Z9_9CHLR|nr:MAG: hypothetical protein EI684_03995 [Candidatus Viridilinea halotolerans]
MSPNNSVRLCAWRSLGAALLLYLALALLMTWPTVLYLTSAVPGNGFDTWQNMWNMWWLREALLTGSNPYFTPYLYYPHGASLLLQTLNPINFLISLPVHALFGLVAAYNFVVIFSLTVSGLATYLLARDVLAESDLPPEVGHLAALLAGTIFACSGYMLSQILGSHTHMLAAWPLPLAVLALRRAAMQPSVGRSILAGGVIALSLLSDWQYLLFTLIWAAWYGLVRFVMYRPAVIVVGMSLPQRLWQETGLRLRQSGVLAVVGAVGVALVLIAPLASATARFSAQVPTAETEGGANFRLEHSFDLADFFIPSQIHPLWGHVAENLQSYKASTHIQNKTAYLGQVTLLLALVGLRSRLGRFWLLSAFVFALLAMGPQLQALGNLTGIPLPGAILYELPLVRISRYPMRFVVYTMIALALLAALGAGHLLTALAQRSQRPVLVRNAVLAGLVLLVVFDNLTTPFPMVRVHIPEIYAELGRDTEEYAILEAPFYYNTSPVFMLYQAAHQKYLVGGYTSRRLPYPLVEQIPTVRMFAYAQAAPDIIAQAPTEIAASVFSYFNIRYLMLHSAGGALRYEEMDLVARAASAEGQPVARETAALRASDARNASGLLRGPLLVEQPAAGSVLAYRVATPLEPLPFLGIGSGWSAPQETEAGVVRRIEGDAAELILYSAQVRNVRVALEAAGAGSLALNVDGMMVEAFALQPTATRHEISLTLPQGATQLWLHPSEAADVVVRLVDVGVE